MSFLDKLLSSRESKRKEAISELASILASSLEKLDPDKRYILFLRQDASDAEIEEVKKLLVEALDLNNSSMKIAIVSGEVRLLEF